MYFIFNIQFNFIWKFRLTLYYETEYKKEPIITGNLIVDSHYIIEKIIFISVMFLEGYFLYLFFNKIEIS